MSTVRDYLTPELRVPFNHDTNYNDGTMRLASTDFLPFVAFTRQGSDAILRGPHVIILETILARTGFKNATVVNSPYEPYGGNMGNGTYSGMIGRLQSGDAYFCLTPSVPTFDRFGFAFAAPSLISPLELLIQKPQKSIDPFSFVKVFDSGMWLALIASFIVSAFCFFVISHYLSLNERSFSYYMWLTFSRLFPQSDLREKDRWLRSFFAIYFLVFSVLLMNIVSGNLVSTMAVRTEQDHIENYADVLRFKKVRIYAEARSYLSDLFLNPTSELFRKLKNQYVPITGTFSVRPSFYPRIEEVEKGSRVIVGNSNMLLNQIEKMQIYRNGQCPNLHTTSSSSLIIPASVQISRAIPDYLMRSIYNGVRAAFESGLQDVCLKWAQRKGHECLAQEDKTRVAKLTLNEVAGSFLFWAIGIGIACSSVIFEFYLTYNENRTQNRIKSSRKVILVQKNR